MKNERNNNRKNPLEKMNEDERMKLTVMKVKAYLIITIVVSTIVFILSLFGIS